MFEPLWPVHCLACGRRWSGVVCPGCRDAAVLRVVTPATPALSGAVAAGRYAGPLGTAVRAAKYGRDRALLVGLGRVLAAVVGPWAAGDVFDAVVPVPSPWTRRMRRGFSSGAVLAGALAAAIEVPVVDALAAVPGPRQATLDQVGRWHNPQRRFRKRRPCTGTVLLVDDVITTGATVHHAARLLRESGATAVWAAALCVAERRAPA